MAQYKDFNLDFEKHPVTNELPVLKDTAAVRNSLKSVILLNKTERFFDPEIGSNIKKYLFEPMNPITVDAIKTDILNNINRYEPRASVISLNVIPNYDTKSYKIDVRFKIVNLDVEDSITFNLDSNA